MPHVAGTRTAKKKQSNVSPRKRLAMGRKPLKIKVKSKRFT